MAEKNGQRKILNADTVAALLFLLLFGAAYAWALPFPPGPPGVPGPAFLPKGLAYVGMSLSLLLLATGIRGRGPAVDWSGVPRQRWAQVAIVVVLLGVYLLLWGKAHFVLLSSGLLLGGSLVLRVPFWIGFLTALVLSAGLYLLFARVFYVML